MATNQDLREYTDQQAGQFDVMRTLLLVNHRSFVTNNSRKHKWLTLYLFYLDFLAAIETSATCMHTLGDDDRAHLLSLLRCMNTADSDAARSRVVNHIDEFIRSCIENPNDTLAAFHTILGMQNDQISNFIARMEAEFAANATRRDQAQAGGVVTNTTTGPDVLQGIVVHTPRRDNSGRLRHSTTDPVSATEIAESFDTTRSITTSFNTTTKEQAQSSSLGEENVEKFSRVRVIEETAPGEDEVGGVSSATVTELNEDNHSTASVAAVQPTKDVENNAGEGGTTPMEHTENYVGDNVACQARCCLIV